MPVPGGTKDTSGADSGFRYESAGHFGRIWSEGAGRAREVSGSSVVLLPHTPASVAAARSQISTQLREAGIVPPAIGDAALVVSELLSNAILHARPLPGAQVQLAWLLHGGSLEVAVSDGGSVTRPRPARASLTSTGGRGLAIVDCLARSWGVRTDDAWTTVWAVLPAPAGRRN